ncbi:SDR family oxidoreductase [Aurantimonas marina]|uniref:SDR family oxidoreductase n=1 Tax=Aurantimonas marina TaxID=2780508 RepID=UPI0019D13484|nr:SDR family oxidoreductase [Aurantimonas marina]
MVSDIAGLRVLVTAGASGIGLEMVRAFQASGARVHYCDVSDGEGAGTDLDGVTASRADVSDRGDVARLFAEVEKRLGGLDVLVNNAGIAGPTGRVEDIDPEAWDQTLNVNITGQFNCTRLAVPLLKRSSNASIVNVASLAGRLGFSMRTPYAASKWAVVGFTKSLAIELGEFGIRVNAILPGSVDGPRIQSVFANKAAALGKSYEEVEAAALAVTSLRKLIPPQHLAAMAVFLASPQGSSISGQALSIDGDAQMMV